MSYDSFSNVLQRFVARRHNFCCRYCHYDWYMGFKVIPMKPSIIFYSYLLSPYLETAWKPIILTPPRRQLRHSRPPNLLPGADYVKTYVSAATRFALQAPFLDPCPHLIWRARIAVGGITSGYCSPSVAVTSGGRLSHVGRSLVVRSITVFAVDIWRFLLSPWNVFDTLCMVAVWRHHGQCVYELDTRAILD